MTGLGSGAVLSGSSAGYFNVIAQDRDIQVTFDFEKETFASLTVFDVMGKLLYRNAVGTTGTYLIINLDIASQIVFVKLHSNDFTLTKR